MTGGFSGAASRAFAARCLSLEVLLARSEPSPPARAEASHHQPLAISEGDPPAPRGIGSPGGGGVHGRRGEGAGEATGGAADRRDKDGSRVRSAGSTAAGRDVDGARASTAGKPAAAGGVEEKGLTVIAREDGG
ncbi:hypothetical protein T484DRAFT_1923225, partial [Baffinella frigidus]